MLREIRKKKSKIALLIVVSMVQSLTVFGTETGGKTIQYPIYSKTIADSKPKEIKNISDELQRKNGDELLHTEVIDLVIAQIYMQRYQDALNLIKSRLETEKTEASRSNLLALASLPDTFLTHSEMGA